MLDDGAAHEVANAARVGSVSTVGIELVLEASGVTYRDLKEPEGCRFSSLRKILL